MVGAFTSEKFGSGLERVLQLDSVGGSAPTSSLALVRRHRFCDLSLKGNTFFDNERDEIKRHLDQIICHNYLMEKMDGVQDGALHLCCDRSPASMDMKFTCRR